MHISKEKTVRRGCGCTILLLLIGNILLAVFVGLQLKSDSESAIVNFHERFNDGKLDAIWNDAHPKFHSTFTTKANYSSYLQNVQKQFGRVKSSSVLKFTWFGTKEITQRTEFEKGEGIETFTFEWRPFKASLVGYSVAAK
jgi:hypothetical protein